MSKSGLQRSWLSAFFWRHSGEILSCSISGLSLLIDGKKRKIPFSKLTEVPSLSRGVFWHGVRISTVAGDYHFKGFQKNEVGLWMQFVQKQLETSLSKQIDTLLPEIERLNSQKLAWKPASKYLRTSEIQNWTISTQQVLKPFRSELLHSFISQTERKKINQLYRDLKTVSEWHQRHNQKFIKQELSKYESFFDQIAGHPMTDKQRIACIVNEDHNLILAGAGSGKTNTMVGRVGYLLSAGHVRGDQVLMLAFAKQAANEMNHRKSMLDAKFPEMKLVSVKTFHALGLDIILHVEKVLPRISELSENRSTLTAFISQVVDKESLDKKFKDSLTKFLDGHISRDALTKLANLLADLLMLAKQRGLSLAELQTVFPQGQQRAELLLSLFEPIASAYEEALNAKGEIDFHQMIHQATSYVCDGRYQSPYQHILVDEFQDISPDRKELLQALLTQQANSVLFAVGDDWQSIYGFTGSEVQITQQFESEFPGAAVNALDKTFRCNQHICDVATRFVLTNPAQRVKKISAIQSSAHSAVFFVPESKNGYGLFSALDAIVQQHSEPKQVLVLARFHFQLNSLFTAELEARLQHQYPALKIERMTVHAAKGQEADHVIVLGMESGEYGFPSEKENDELLQLLRAEIDTFPYAEERRLFYVALTRAKESVYLVYDRNKPSPFITELAAKKYKVGYLDATS